MIILRFKYLSFELMQVEKLIFKYLLNYWLQPILTK